MDIDKCLGCIYGVMVGDALGTRYEFKKRGYIKKQLKDDLQNGRLDILGGGPFHMAPGQVTDDSEMMLSLLRSLAKYKMYLQRDVAKNYIEWFHSKPPDIGNTTYRALNGAKNHIDMMDNSEMNYTSLSNGCLMRIAPLGLFGLKLNDEQLRSIVRLECSLTHSNPETHDICFLYVLAIKYSLLGYDRSNIYLKMMENAKTERAKILLLSAKVQPEPVYVISDGKVKYVDTDGGFGGYIGVAFQNAIYEFMNGYGYNSSILNILKRGSDTDTNCAIAGGLLGAYYGIKRIDSGWLFTLTSCNCPRYDQYSQFIPNKARDYIKKLL